MAALLARARPLRTPRAELSKSVCFEQARRFRDDLGRHPLREGDFLDDVAPGGGVFFVDLGEVPPGEASRRTNERWPEPAVNEGDLAVDEAANEDVLAPADGPSELEDLVTSRMGPPAPLDGPTRDGEGE